MSTLAPSYAVSFTFTLDGNTRLFGKINSYCHSSENDGQIDIYISKLLVKWLDPTTPPEHNLRVGVLGIYPIVCPADSPFPCDTSISEVTAFDFYYDTWMGRGFLFGNEVTVVW
jgi:hypothetical protein